MKNSKVQKINSIGGLENRRLSDSGRSEESPRNERIMGGDPPKNGAKSWLKAKKPGGEKPGPGASVIGGTALDQDSPPPPPTPVVREERVNPKEKELHSVARNKVVTNPRAKSIPRKVKDVMTYGETQEVARSPACRRMKTNLKEPYTPPRVPSRPEESPPPPPPRIAREEKVKPGEKELHSVARSKVKTNPRTRSTPRKIKDVMIHEETQGVANSPSCCEKIKVNQKLSGPRSPVKQPEPSCLPPDTGEESRRSAESSSRASTRTSRPGKTSSAARP